MSITKSYNKQTGIYYAYETTYEWSDEKQKKVQRKRCIGQFDPETGEVVPNGKVGRPSLSQKKTQRKPDAKSPQNSTGASSSDIVHILAKLTALEEVATSLSHEIHETISEVKALSGMNT